MTTNTTTRVQFHVTMTMDCPICQGTGSDHGAPCTDCAGTGTVAEPVELADALRAIGFTARLDAIERTAGRAMQYAEVMANGGI